MTELFLDIVNLSISAGWLVLVVLMLRLMLNKAPKWVNVLLWGIVAVRLILPFSIESALSLIPSRATISPEIMMDWTPEISTGIEPLDRVVNPVISTSFAPKPWTSANPLQILIPVAANIWLLGVVGMLIYTGISYLVLRQKLRTAVILRDNVFQCETVNSPFVLGILKPRIYLPYTMDDQNLIHVIAHEQAHIRRKDHWWKPFGFLLLTIHWFNPLMWVAYILLCQDIELACDEKVIAELGNEQRADYTQALVACSVNRRIIAACPLAFGEVGVKNRVKSIMNYRKPTFWIIVTALVACVVVAVCFLTDPNPSREFSMRGKNVSSLDSEAIVERVMDIEDIDNSNVYMNSDNFTLQVDSNFNWANSQTVSYFFWKNHKPQSGQLHIFPDEDKYFLTEPTEWQEQNRIFLLRHYLDAVRYLPQYEIKQMAPADQYIIQFVDGGLPSDYERVIRYSANGVGDTGGWFIHLQIQPLHTDGEGYHGIGEEVIDVFYGEDTISNLIPKSKVFADSKDDIVGVVSSIENMEPINTQNGDILILQNDGGLWHFNEGQQVDVSVVFENDGSFMSMKSIGYIYCGDCSEGLYANEIFSNQNVPQSNGSFTVPETGNYLFYFRNYSSSWIKLYSVSVEYGSFLQAKILEIRDGYFLVEPVKGSWELNIADKIEVSIKNMSPSPEPQVGDILQIEYDGEIAETFPAKISKVYHIALEQTKNFSQTMIPTDTDQLGYYLCALLVPIDGNVYRYQLTEENPEGLSIDELLYSFTEETQTEDILWEVYSLKEYPDKTAVLMLSGTNRSWLCQYFPPYRCPDNALSNAIEGGNVVMEDGIATHGQDIWNEFYALTQ